MIDEIFLHNGCEEVDDKCYQYADVTFLVTFGIFKAGEKCEMLCVDYENGVIEEYKTDSDGVVRSTPMRLIPR